MRTDETLLLVAYAHMFPLRAGAGSVVAPTIDPKTQRSFHRSMLVFDFRAVTP
jgi:hypothetical protein